MEGIICRKQQLELLRSLFGQNSDYAPPALFIYGHTGTGKSFVVDTILAELEVPHVMVNCVECYSQQVLYENILNKLSISCSPVRNEPYKRCENMNNFIKLLVATISETQSSENTTYIVLDRAERLRDLESHILPAFLRLQELTALNITVILLSEIVWEKFRTADGFIEPYIINFPDYSKHELVKILCLDCPQEYSQEFYATYISLVLSVFYLVCRDLKELRFLAKLNFPKFVEPIKFGKATEDDTCKLWRNMEPHLKKALQTVYLREVSSSQWEKMQQGESSIQQGNLQQLSNVFSRSHVELPFYSKYLLIAAYLASYNPAKTDRRFFSKNSGRNTKKRLKKNINHERTTNHLLGPKLFSLDRLMAVFYSIVDSKVAPTADIFMQISSLVTLRLLVQVSGDEQLDTPKYKCLVSLDFIKSIARTVNFDIVRYLFDFI